MKNKKILIISLCAVLIALVAAASVMLKRNSISKHSLIYADVNDNKLISYKISEKRKPGFLLTDIRNICLSASISVGNIAAFPRAKIHFMMCC